MRERNKIRRQREALENLPTVPFEEEESLPATSPNQHHHISIDDRQKVQVVQWTDKNKNDPAVKVSCYRLCLLTAGLMSHFVLGFYSAPQKPPSITSRESEI